MQTGVDVGVPDSLQELNVLPAERVEFTIYAHFNARFIHALHHISRVLVKERQGLVQQGLVESGQIKHAYNDVAEAVANHVNQLQRKRSSDEKQHMYMRQTCSRNTLVSTRESEYTTMA